MGTIAKQVPGGVTKYYWYPGDKAAWKQAAIAVVAGGLTFVVASLASGSALWPAVLGTSASLAVAGVSVGRRDVRAVREFPDFVTARRAALGGTLRAVARALIRGVAGAATVVLVVHLPPRGIVADWILPAVPALVGVVAHQAGMLYERVAQMPGGGSDDTIELETAGH